jgi:hypothetical protein
MIELRYALFNNEVAYILFFKVQNDNTLKD